MFLIELHASLLMYLREVARSTRFPLVPQLRKWIIARRVVFVRLQLDLKCRSIAFPLV